MKQFVEKEREGMQEREEKKVAHRDEVRTKKNHDALHLLMKTKERSARKNTKKTTASVVLVQKQTKDFCVFQCFFFFFFKLESIFCFLFFV